MKNSKCIIMCDCGKCLTEIYSHDSVGYRSFPTISSPRVFRNDWIFERNRRASLFNKLKIQRIICHNNEKKLIEGLFAGFPIEVVGVGKEQTHNCQLDRNTIVGGWESLLLKARYSIRNIDGLKTYKCPNDNSDSIVIIENIRDAFTYAGVNYAINMGYDVIVYSKLPYECEHAINQYINRVLIEERLIGIDLVRELFKKYIDIEYIESLNKRVQFISHRIPISILLPYTKAALLWATESELKLLIDLRDNQQRFRNRIPAFLLVDMEETDIENEVPEIIDTIELYDHYKILLKGKLANPNMLSAFIKYCPTDLIYVAGHGEQDGCYLIEEEFVDSDGDMHTVKCVEYPSIGPFIEGKFKVWARYKFLEYDGIIWSDKEKLKSIKMAIKEYLPGTDSNRLISRTPATYDKFAGVKMNDGVFADTPEHICNNNLPIIILNTCHSLNEISSDLSFAGFFVQIGTLWHILDKAAYEFGKSIINEMRAKKIFDAFLFARDNIEDERSRRGYVYVGTLNAQLLFDGMDCYEELSKRNWSQEVAMAKSEYEGMKEAGLTNNLDAENIQFVMDRINDSEKLPNKRLTGTAVIS